MHLKLQIVLKRGLTRTAGCSGSTFQSSTAIVSSIKLVTPQHKKYKKKEIIIRNNIIKNNNTNK
jgi:hypothetical protein